MRRKPTKKLIATFNLKETFRTYKELEDSLRENGIEFTVETGSYGGGGKVFYDYKRNAIVISTYLQRTYNNFQTAWKYTHYIIKPTNENIEKLSRLLKTQIKTALLKEDKNENRVLA